MNKSFANILKSNQKLDGKFISYQHAKYNSDIKLKIINFDVIVNPFYLHRVRKNNLLELDFNLFFAI